MNKNITTAGKPERWVHSQSKRPHSHDVRALCVACLPGQDPVLVSGGNDAQLLVHSVPRYTQVGSLPMSLYSRGPCSYCMAWTLFALSLLHTMTGTIKQSCCQEAL